MRLRKILVYLLIIILTFLALSITTEANPTEGAENVLPQEAQLSEDTKQQITEYCMDFINWDKLLALEEELRTSTPSLEKYSIEEQMKRWISGEVSFSLEEIIRWIGNALVGEIGLFIKLGARFILIVLLCNLLQTMTSSFKSKDTATIGFFVCYLTILLSVVQSFVVMINLAYETVEQLLMLMNVSIPVLLAFMTTTGYGVSAAAMAPIILTGLSMLSYVIKVVALPLIIYVIILQVISTMSEEIKVDALISIFYKGIKWGLRGIMLLSTSVLGLYRMVLPYADETVKQATVKFTTAFIPILGGAVGGTVDFLVKCSGLIRNAFSTGVIIWILAIASIPLIKILAYCIIYQVAGAVIEPLGDKKMAKMALQLSKGCQFILSAVGMVALFCVCSLLICMSIGTA